MLKRQKILLTILHEAKRPLSHIELVKTAFLLDQETVIGREVAFYDFVPYRFGPFSFALNRELSAIVRDGYVVDRERTVELAGPALELSKEKVGEVPARWRTAVRNCLSKYLVASQNELLSDVYSRYPWFAINSELTKLVSDNVKRPTTKPAIFTVGYEGKSVDSFFNGLIEQGIEAIVDVRANPISRKYGLARKSMSEIATKLGISYQHMPALGIASSERADLSDFDSYQRLLDRYETEMLPNQTDAVNQVATQMTKRPSALLCMEKDVRCCHRGRLAEQISQKTKMIVRHI